VQLAHIDVVFKHVNAVHQPGLAALVTAVWWLTVALEPAVARYRDWITAGEVGGWPYVEPPDRFFPRHRPLKMALISERCKCLLPDRPVGYNFVVQ
jgi:hypothetical protein